MARKKLRKVPTQNARKDSFCDLAPSVLRRSRKYLYVLGIDCCRYVPPQFSKLMFCQILEIPGTLVNRSFSGNSRHISQSFFFGLTLRLVYFIWYT